MKKYSIRFIPVILVTIALMYFFGGPQGITTSMRKLLLCVMGFITGETMWFIWHKLNIGEMEELENEKLKSYSLLRGIIDAAFIIGMALGL